jgi:predicted amidohydrolase
MVTYFGHSTLVDPWGDTVIEAGEHAELQTAEIDMGLVAEVRSGMQVLRDRRPELYGQP